MSSLHISKISLEVFNTTLKRYSDIASSSLAELDTLRYETIPSKLANGKKDAHLLKADVEKLVEWKLKHGTFRPTLMGLVKSNPADTIKETTQSAFAEPDVMKALKILTSLRGIGPATTSLLLSVHQPDTVPFFSDELFRWSQWDAAGKKGDDKGWDRKIKYNVGEYKEVLKSMGELRKRLGVRAVDAEKVAYVLGKEMADIDGDGGGEGKGEDVADEEIEENKEKGGDAQAESAKRVQVALAEIRTEKARGNGKERKAEAKELKTQISENGNKTGTKRKAREERPPAEGTRKSARTRS
ncbi:hypothetical protein E8E11_011506 [Didymella keratinophila]|nr:hypothetical protein E8E11_011506 [Didymella keratinophila]